MTLTFTPREAKEFIVGEIVAEADRENVMLSDIECKMLYFSETAWSLPDIYEVNEAFKQSYDSDEYEAKIASLINNAVHRLREHDTRSLKAWKQAVRTLNQEDHYLSVLIGIADGSLHLSTQSSGLGVLQFLQVLLIIFGGAVTLLIAIAMYLRLTGQV